MNQYAINILVIDQDYHLIEKIYNYIGKFNLKIEVLACNTYTEATSVIDENYLDYIFVSEQLLLYDHIRSITEQLALRDNSDCVIILLDCDTAGVESISNGTFLFPNQLSFDFFKKLVGYAIVNKKTYDLDNKIINDVYQDNFIASHDALTMLPNRFHATQKLSEFINTARNNTKEIAIIFLDLDGFKDINDKAGHKAGDEVLKEVARRLIQNTRVTDLVARLGGDEFLVVLPFIRDKEDADIVAHKIQAVLTEPYHVDSESWMISASLGVAVYPYDADSADKLIVNADTAMYESKRLGKNRIHYFDKELNDKLTKKYNILNDIRESLINNDFEILLQAQHEIKENKLLGAEVFVRWQHPEKGEIPPNEFIPVLLDTGYINALGEYILNQAVEVSNNTVQTLPIRLAINVEARQLASDDFIEHIEEFANNKKLNLNHLAIEITEDSFASNFNFVRARLEKLKSLGVQVYLDDFGVGDSSITKLIQLPIDVIKIDNKYFRDDSTEEYQKNLIDIAHSCKIRVMAKRVDDEKELDFLRRIGCDGAQGYCYSKQMSLEEFSSYLQNYTLKYSH